MQEGSQGAFARAAVSTSMAVWGEDVSSKGGAASALGETPSPPSSPSSTANPRPQDESNVGELLPAAGVKLGADLTLRMRGLARGGKDSLQAECKFNQASDQYVLKKVRMDRVWGGHEHRRRGGVAQGGRGREPGTGCEACFSSLWAQVCVCAVSAAACRCHGSSSLAALCLVSGGWFPWLAHVQLPPRNSLACQLAWSCSFFFPTLSPPPVCLSNSAPMYCMLQVLYYCQPRSASFSFFPSFVKVLLCICAAGAVLLPAVSSTAAGAGSVWRHHAGHCIHPQPAGRWAGTGTELAPQWLFCFSVQRAVL